MGEAIIEGHYLETAEGLFFAVKGHLHPPRRTIAYLRYLPHEAGSRERDGRRYRRVYHFPEQEEILRRQYPHYLFYDPVYGRELQGVPLRQQRHVYSPRRGLAALRRSGVGGPAEDDTLLLASLLHERAGVDWACLGVSGSLLIGLSTPASDIDLIVYGAENGRAVQRALRELFAEQGEVRPLVGDGVRRLYRSRLPDTRMRWADFLRHERRKVNQGTCRGREYFIRFVKEADEMGERYGERRYRKLGRARIRGRIADDADALFTPCLYRVERVTADGDPLPGTVQEITSFRGRFSEQARVGEWVVAQGTLERVTERSGGEYLRLVLGEHPDDIMVVTS